MNFAELGMADLLGTFVGFVLTLMVFSYIIGDNILFRLAIHIFIGVAAGFTAVVVWYNVIWPQLLVPLVSGGSGRLLLIVPLVLGGLLLTKASPRLSGLGSPAVAYLVGVGAAAAIGGAVLGTIFPQVGATVNLFDWQTMSLSENGFLFEFLNGSIILVGTVTTLIYFHFGARAQPGRTPQRAPWIDAVAWVGKVFIAITFGALFAGVYAASLVALIERLDSFISMILP